MRTPKEWSENLKKGIVTEDMLEAALFSVNKRAKNWRDKKREYKRCRYAAHDYAGQAEAQEKRMYEKKEALLQTVQPVCIHQESWGYERQRVYNFGSKHSDAELSAIYQGLVVHTGSFVNHHRDWDTWDDDFDDYGYGDGCVTTFADVEDPAAEQTRSYLFYLVGEHSFHTPIPDKDLINYPDLPVYFIEQLETEGKDTKELASMPYVDKVIGLIQSRAFTYVPRDRTPEEQEMVRKQAFIGAVDHKAYAESRRKELISEDVQAFGDDILECMRAYAKRNVPAGLPALSEEEKEEIRKSAEKTVKDQLTEPCKRLSRLLSSAGWKSLQYFCQQIDKGRKRLLNGKTLKPYQCESKNAGFLKDSVAQFGGKEVSAKELVEAYPDQAYLDRLPAFLYRQEITRSLVNKTWSKYKSIRDEANLLWQSKRAEEKQNRKFEKQQNRKQKKTRN